MVANAACPTDPFGTPDGLRFCCPNRYTHPVEVNDGGAVRMVFSDPPPSNQMFVWYPATTLTTRWCGLPSVTVPVNPWDAFTVCVPTWTIRSWLFPSIHTNTWLPAVSTAWNKVSVSPACRVGAANQNSNVNPLFPACCGVYQGPPAGV